MSKACEKECNCALCTVVRNACVLERKQTLKEVMEVIDGWFDNTNIYRTKEELKQKLGRLK